MKETPIFEEVQRQLIRQPKFTLKVVIGGLLSFIPVVNILAFGYLYRFTSQLRRSGQPALPEWNEWQGLFLDGLRFGAVWVLFWLLPVLLASGLSSLMAILHVGALGYLIFMSVCLCAPLFFSAALYRLQMRSDFKDLLDLSLIARMTWTLLPRYIVPALALLGFSVLLLPLYGLALFAGFLGVLAFTSLCYRQIERQSA
ncbi:DUF4013 domain-containing protein [Coraliomargarita parva]|uniref:DUF4013 domain-containing protein n=1 Tax=Coraliomargarita parva TaxID=3014050 RepID=UPI0022B53631|nr:DUF4013 domain-containing protein [Coraliomargarita parva]